MKSQFNKSVLSSKAKVDEINLFKEMMRYLNATNAQYRFVKNVHAHAGFIDFHSTNTGKIEKIEIADLLIVNHNIKRRETRICFIQAKYKKDTFRSFISFRGDSYQWELLLRRPDIIDRYGSGFPENILSFTEYKSITSYGIFYRDRKGEIDFLFTLADHLHSSSRKKSTTLSLPGMCYCPNEKCKNGIGTKETFSTCSMDEFENQLLNGNIGAPIDSTIKPYILSLLMNLYTSDSEHGHEKFYEEIIKRGEFDFNRFDGAMPTPKNTLVLLTGLHNE